jgi:hypothetical protein
MWNGVQGIYTVLLAGLLLEFAVHLESIAGRLRGRQVAPRDREPQKARGPQRD